MGKKWTDEEKALVVEATSEDDLMVRYLKKFGAGKVARVHSLWSHRKRLLEEDKEPEVAPTPVDDRTFQQLQNIHSVLQELVNIQKATYLLFKEIQRQK